jgi:proteasome lid subunit RPN8/RPN11
MTLYLTKEASEGIARHGEEGYPNEICGLLIGKDEPDGRVICALVPVKNEFEQDEQYHRFLITPDAMFRAERLARKERLDVLGIYHSHPNEEARPSLYDRDHAAWTAWSYIIVSVREGKAAELRAWKLREDRSAFDEEDVAVSTDN